MGAQRTRAQKRLSSLPSVYALPPPFSAASPRSRWVVSIGSVFRAPSPSSKGRRCLASSQARLPHRLCRPRPSPARTPPTSLPMSGRCHGPRPRAPARGAPLQRLDFNDVLVVIVGVVGGGVARRAVTVHGLALLLQSREPQLQLLDLRLLWWPTRPLAGRCRARCRLAALEGLVEIGPMRAASRASARSCSIGFSAARDIAAASLVSYSSS